jgi:hypothetical protein
MGNFDIITSIREIAKTDKAYSLSCLVNGVDTSTNTCDVEPLDGSSDILNVKLIAQSNGLLIYPKINSLVIVSFLDPNNGFVSMYSDIDDIKIKVENEIWLNGDDLDGLVSLNDLVTKLNNLENTLNAHIAKYNAHIHTGGTIAGNTAIPTILDTNTLTPTLASEIENPTIKQGTGI